MMIVIAIIVMIMIITIKYIYNVLIRYCQCMAYHVQAIPLGSGSHQRAPASVWLAWVQFRFDSVFTSSFSHRGLLIRPAFIRSGDNRDIEVCGLQFCISS